MCIGGGACCICRASRSCWPRVGEGSRELCFRRGVILSCGGPTRAGSVCLCWKQGPPIGTATGSMGTATGSIMGLGALHLASCGDAARSAR